ncbi:MAG: DUF6232 family protein [Flavobacteriales bacterium]
MNTYKSEKTFYTDPKIRITQSRIIIGSKTYTLSNVSSVQSEIRKKSKISYISMIILGIVSFPFLSLISLLLIIVGILLLILRKKHYTIRIHTNSGEVNLLSSKDESYIKNIVNAINDAIVFRG